VHHHRPSNSNHHQFITMKNTRPRCETPAPKTEVELLATDYARRVTVEDHLHFQKSIRTDERGIDEIDRMLDEQIEVDPYNGDPPSKRSDKEISRVLSILDSLDERGNG